MNRVRWIEAEGGEKEEKEKLVSYTRKQITIIPKSTKVRNITRI